MQLPGSPHAIAPTFWFLSTSSQAESFDAAIAVELLSVNTLPLCKGQSTNQLKCSVFVEKKKTRNSQHSTFECLHAAFRIVSAFIHRDVAKLVLAIHVGVPTLQPNLVPSFQNKTMLSFTVQSSHLSTQISRRLCYSRALT